jgi:hypothetical protein
MTMTEFQSTTVDHEMCLKNICYTWKKSCLKTNFVKIRNLSDVVCSTIEYKLYKICNLIVHYNARLSRCADNSSIPSMSPTTAIFCSSSISNKLCHFLLRNPNKKTTLFGDGSSNGLVRMCVLEEHAVSIFTLQGGSSVFPEKSVNVY